MKPLRERAALLIGGVVIGLCVVIWVIAGSDRLFLSTVPIAQRLISHNETIRKKAQQELLGIDVDAKRGVAAQLAPVISQDDPFPSKWAAIALALIGPSAQEALPVLLQCVSSPEKDVAQACRVAISEIGTPDVQQLPNLLQALDDTRSAVRCEAASSLGRMGPAAHDAVPTLLKKIENSVEVPECLCAAAAELAPELPDMMTGLSKLLSHASEAVRRNAATALATVGPRSPEEIEALLRLLTDDASGEVRRLAAHGLGLRQTPEIGALPALGGALRHSKSETVRLAALEMLRKLNLPLAQLEPLLLSALQDSAVPIRLATVRWLKELDLQSRFAMSSLIPLLKDSDLDVRRTTLEILRLAPERRKELRPFIAKAQRDSDPTIRCVAAETLVEMGASDRVSVPLLVADLKNMRIGDCAADALGMAGHFNNDVVPALIRLLEEKDREIRRRAIHALFQLGAKGRDALPALSQAQRDKVPGAENAIHAIREALPRDQLSVGARPPSINAREGWPRERRHR